MTILTICQSNFYPMKTKRDNKMKFFNPQKTLEKKKFDDKIKNMFTGSGKSALCGANVRENALLF